MNFVGYCLRIDWPFGGITLRVEHLKGVLYYYTKSQPEMNFFSLALPLLVTLWSSMRATGNEPRNFKLCPSGVDDIKAGTPPS
ncbi:hypothetical protein TNCV_4934921 [Trichonephila clavipes]|uniref:Uncharacterized protein n=1 Tax=Trichonephila clavipes TaxID=2585209 RepID=A0A8X6VLE5_TRICX|nr:hypothetical protein TNCV_4934921 [Trichonephila clavipes]